jgi:sarcosine oxidase subunit alpha
VSEAATIELRVNGRSLRAPADVTVAVALLQNGVWSFRRSVRGEARGPLCGMGICYECRLTIDGVAQKRACMTPVAQGMEISTGG